MTSCQEYEEDDFFEIYDNGHLLGLFYATTQESVEYKIYKNAEEFFNDNAIPIVDSVEKTFELARKRVLNECDFRGFEGQNIVYRDYDFVVYNLDIKEDKNFLFNVSDSAYLWEKNAQEKFCFLLGRSACRVEIKKHISNNFSFNLVKIFDKSLEEKYHFISFFKEN